MSTSEADHLPQHLREALLAEIDPGETLRWCGRPLVSRITRRLIAPMASLIVFGVVLGGLALRVALTTRAELLGIEPSHFTGHNQDLNWETVWAMMTIGTVVCLFSILGPIFVTLSETRRARRTVYALTGTRVLRLWLDTRGRARVFAVEPGHPLSLSRHDLGDGRGDISLYPLQGRSSAGQASSLLLAGIEDARNVERLIRATFDPPGGAKQ